MLSDMGFLRPFSVSVVATLICFSVRGRQIGFFVCDLVSFGCKGEAMSEYTREACIELLLSKYRELGEAGAYPKRSDFSEREVVAIKACFGPWPRALEAAGIKSPRTDDRKEKNREKRARAKRRRREAPGESQG